MVIMLRNLQKKEMTSLQEVQISMEVAGVLDDMLHDLEICDAENNLRRHQRELSKKQALVELLDAKVSELEAHRKENTERFYIRASEAQKLRETLASELWTLSKTLKSTTSLEKRLERAEEIAAKVPKLERELDEAYKGQPRMTSSNVPVVKDGVSDDLVAFIARALGGKKWRKAAAEYTTKLAAHSCTSIDAVVRMNQGQLQGLGVSPAHALLVSVHPRPGASLQAYSAPLMILEDKLLLKSFSYLKANSVLSTAQVCRPVFTRVDALFGMGSTLHSKAVVVPPPPTSTAPLPPTPAEAAHPLGDLAKKIAAKLNSTEMKGIVQMTERIRRLEAETGHLAQAKEDTETKLESTEKVKDFLVDKLKDTELVLKRTIDAANESARQHQADQEVINFLDGRVHELEQLLSEAQETGVAKDKGLAEAERLEMGRVKSLEELLQWEREKANKMETEAKGQKKLLVKEVKALRAQLTAVTADRDSYKRQASALMARK